LSVQPRRLPRDSQTNWKYSWCEMRSATHPLPVCCVPLRFCCPRVRKEYSHGPCPLRPKSWRVSARHEHRQSPARCAKRIHSSVARCD
jgi:hypothetical protein